MGVSPSLAQQGTTRLMVTRTTEDGVDVFALSIEGDEDWAGPRGAFYRSRREVRDARVIEVTPPEGRPIPPGSNQQTQLALWNEVGEDGKLWPHRAIRHGGSHAEELHDSTPPLGNWVDENGDGVGDLGFVCIGDIDYRLMIRYSEFNPVAIAGSQEEEPWRVGEAEFPPGLAAGDVPAYDRDGDGKPDPTGFAGGGCHIYIVQFWTQSLPELREGMVAAGEAEGGRVAVHNFLPHNSYIVELPEEAAAERIRELPYVRWVGAFHPAYRVDRALMARYYTPGSPGPEGDAVRYNLEVFERGIRQKEIVAGRIEALGGRTARLDENGFLVLPTMPAAGVAELLRMDEVAFVGEWGPKELQMVVARELTGASYLATAPAVPLPRFRGQGVRGEVVDNCVLTSHPDLLGTQWQYHGVVPSCNFGHSRHGTCCFGIVFATGDSDSSATGMLPEADRAYFASLNSFGAYDDENAPTSRYDHIEELAAVPLEAVFQSNSWGHQKTAHYNAHSRQMDDIIFMTDIIICQAHGNSGDQLAVPESWAKNTVSVGGIVHHNTVDRSDDEWHSVVEFPNYPSASIGPAEDGRIKPDLSNLYDNIYTTSAWNIEWAKM